MGPNGLFVGSGVGACEMVGAAVGRTEGRDDGLLVGCRVGCMVGRLPRAEHQNIGTNIRGRGENIGNVFNDEEKCKWDICCMKINALVDEIG